MFDVNIEFMFFDIYFSVEFIEAFMLRKLSFLFEFQELVDVLVISMNFGNSWMLIPHIHSYIYLHTETPAMKLMWGVIALE